MLWQHPSPQPAQTSEISLDAEPSDPMDFGIYDADNIWNPSFDTQLGEFSLFPLDESQIETPTDYLD